MKYIKYLKSWTKKVEIISRSSKRKKGTTKEIEHNLRRIIEKERGMGRSLAKVKKIIPTGDKVIYTNKNRKKM